VTSNIVDAIGHEVNVTNAVTYLAEEAFVDLTPTSTKGDKFVDVFDGTSGSASNAVIVLTGTLKTKGTTTSLSGKIQGVWADGVSAVTGTIKGKTE
jgi:hypothetical protein